MDLHRGRAFGIKASELLLHVAATPWRKRFRLQRGAERPPDNIFDRPSRQGFREALRRLASSVRTSLNEGRQIGL